VVKSQANLALMIDQQLADRFEAWELPPWQDDPALLSKLIIRSDEAAPNSVE
jgi:hypothetical protein